MNVEKMDIPINVGVKCCGRDCGRSTHIVLNPVSKDISHIVVKQREFPHTERLVPVEFIAESTPDMIRLHCDTPDLAEMEEFVQTEFVEAEETHIIGDPYLMCPYVYSTKEYIPKSHKQIPLGELAIRRGARVIAQDGPVGRVDEFVVDHQNEHITHLIMREGHLWKQQEVTVPVSYIEHIQDDAVYLNIDKAHVATLAQNTASS